MYVNRKLSACTTISRTLEDADFIVIICQYYRSFNLSFSLLRPVHKCIQGHCEGAGASSLSFAPEPLKSLGIPECIITVIPCRLHKRQFIPTS